MTIKPYFFTATLFAFAIASSLACAQDGSAQNKPTSKASTATTEQVAKGVVYNDVNRNQKFDRQDFALKGIRVSNGKEIVRTNEFGRYAIPIQDDSIVFVIKPSGLRTPMSKDRLPRFYYNHKPNGSPSLTYKGVAPTGALPESIDFPLYPQIEPSSFEIILFGDPQSRNVKEINYVANDVVTELIGRQSAFGVTLGDIVFDDLDMFEHQNAAVALVGIPWYNVIGNHDINFDAGNRKHANESFERHYGPSYYSFDYGQVHFVVMDNINWIVPENDERPKYVGGFGDKQIEFLKNDLALIPENQMIVLLMHIPLQGVEDRQKVYRLIEKRPLSLSISGHTHYHEHQFIDEKDGWKGSKPHHHIINVTVSGSWWGGNKDERGIPHSTMRDGAPNGYSILKFDGTKYQLDFKAAGRSSDYQMNIMVADAKRQGQLDKAKVFVNVFNGSPNCQVEYELDRSGTWTEMKREARFDPLYTQAWNAEQKVVPKIEPGLSKPVVSSHLWMAALPNDLTSGTHLIRTRWTDYNGRVRHAFQVFRLDEKLHSEKDNVEDAARK